MKCGTSIGILTLACLALPRVVAAQDVGTSLDELLRARELRPGVGVYVTDATGRRIKGDVTDVSSTGLEITDGRDTWTLAESDVRKIERQDPVETGIWIGIGIAVASTYALCGFEYLGGAEFCYGAAYSFLPAVAAGAGIGWYVDATNHRTIYQKSGSVRLTVSPMVSKERLGAAAAFSW